MQQTFIRFAAICCLLSVITTLGIHAYFPDPPTDFEQRILLFRDKTYLLNRWWVIVHCLLVIVSMWGFALLRFKRSPGFTGLGFLFFCVFGIAEITRQMIVLFYTNGLREQYFVTTDLVVREQLRTVLIHAGLLTAPLFGLFILSFGLGGIFYGLSLAGTKGLDKILSFVFIVSGITSCLFLGNSFWKMASLEQFIEKFNLIYTPAMRGLIGLWLWKWANGLRKTFDVPVQPA